MKTLTALVVFLFICFSLDANSQEAKPQDENNQLPCVEWVDIQEVGELTMLFEWLAVNIPGLIGYELQVATDSDFDDIILDIITSKNEYTWEAPEIGNYYARIRIAVILEEIPGPFCYSLVFNVEDD